MSNEQCFSLCVPNQSAYIHVGSGPVPGFSFTTAGNAFHHANVNAIHEAKTGDARLMATGVLANMAKAGILVGTPCTIQAAAGGGVQIYAGATVEFDLGTPTGPGAPFGPSKPADFSAGDRAESLNRINDGIKGAGDIIGGGLDMASDDWADRVKGALGVVKGTWDVLNAATDEERMGTESAAIDGVTGAINLVTGVMSGDMEGALQAVSLGAKYLGKGFEGSAGNAGAGIGNATAPTEPSTSSGAAGGSLGAPGDGPRIHEVAPANIDRKCGADMTAKVAGKKTATVDGNIEYKSGASIKMNAFNKVETQSLFFSAHANVKATMTGLAIAKVESLGSATLEGKARFKVATMAIGKIEASQLSIAAKAQAIFKSPTINVEGNYLKIKNQTQIYNRLFVQKVTELGDDFVLDGEAELKKSAKIKQAIKAGGELVVKGAGKIKGMCKLG